jgi:hypothetical protein
MCARPLAAVPALLPRSRQTCVRAALRRAYRAGRAPVARRQRLALATVAGHERPRRGGHAGGAEETLSVRKLEGVSH